MKAIGIIIEYNPFHNGHMYHLEEIKKMFPESIIIAVMSGHFMQRGEPSIINKWEKTHLALQAGVDIVLELPFVFATQASDIFAHAAVSMLNEMQVEAIVFGSETNDIKKLKKLAKTQLNTKGYEKKAKKYLKEGVNYPTALNLALKDFAEDEVTSPNDILGLSYIKEIIKNDFKIKPISIKRTNNYHSKKLSGKYVSATSIRKALKENVDIKNYVPKFTYDALKNNHLHFYDDYFSLLKYKIMTTSPLEFKKYLGVDEGIENRLIKEIINVSELEDYIQKIKTKRYTYNRIRRMLTHILVGLKKDIAIRKKDIEYLRVLGLSEKGKIYLKKIKKETSVPIITDIKKIDSEILNLELKATNCYVQVLTMEEAKVLIKKEYNKKPIMK